ncbi:MAG TPA: tetratricopeptide repeat protein [Thermoanaerobaculia bacterium]
MGDMILSGQFEEALAKSRELLKTTEHDSKSRALITRLSWDALVGLEQEGLALQRAQEALHGEDAIASMALDFLASYYFAANEHEKVLALAESSRSEARTPKMEVAWGISSVRALTHMGRSEEAVEELRKLANRFGENGELRRWARNGLWLIRHNQGDLEGAVSLLDAAAMYFPSLRKDAQFLNNQGAAHYEFGNDQVAEISYMQALAQAETSEQKAISYFGLANSAYRVKRYEQALQYLDRLDRLAAAILSGVDFFAQSLILRELVESEMQLSSGLGGPIDEKGACWINCEPPPPHDCKFCCSSNNLTSIMNLEGSGSAFEATDSTVTLKNLVDGPVANDGTQVRYLLEEWAIVSVERGLSASSLEIRTVNASSAAIAKARLADLRSNPASVAAVGEGGRSILVVEAPVHPENSRSMRLPDISLATSRPGVELVNGTVLVRGFFSEAGALETVAVLHAFDGYPSKAEVPNALLDFLRLNLVLDSSADGANEHPVVVFVSLQIRDGNLRIADSVRIVPLCCCGTEFCV